MNFGNQYKTQIKKVLYVDGLKHNLLGISQLCDKGFKIEFNKNYCLISEAMSGQDVHIGKRVGNIYMLNIISKLRWLSSLLCWLQVVQLVTALL